MKLTSEQIKDRGKIVCKMREGGMTLAEIGEKINRSKEAVRVIILKHTRLERERNERRSALQGLTVRELMGRSILDLELNGRARRFFYNEQRYLGREITVQDVIEMSDAELRRFPNFGRLTITETRGAIAKALADAEKVKTNEH
jgi:DNA-directed RNA polymerase alpha subunit